MRFQVSVGARRRVRAAVAAVGAVALLFGLIVLGLNRAETARAIDGPAQGSEQQITFCHANAPGQWTQITTSVNAFFQGGHINHEGDIWPAFSFVTNQGNTVNIPAQGDQAILANHCVATTPTPTVTATATVTETATATVTQTLTPTVIVTPPPVTETVVETAPVVTVSASPTTVTETACPTTPAAAFEGRGAVRVVPAAVVGAQTLGGPSPVVVTTTVTETTTGTVTETVIGPPTTVTAPAETTTVTETVTPTELVTPTQTVTEVAASCPPASPVTPTTPSSPRPPTVAPTEASTSPAGGSNGGSNGGGDGSNGGGEGQVAGTEAAAPDGTGRATVLGTEAGLPTAVDAGLRGSTVRSDSGTRAGQLLVGAGLALLLLAGWLGLRRPHGAHQF
jgi:hypothetical protein